MDRFRNKAIKRGAGLVTATLCLAFILLAVHAFLPGWLERQASDILGDRGIEVRSFEVEATGPSHGSLGRGFLVYDTLSVQWQSVELDYSPLSLLEGNVRSIVMSEPLIEIQVPPFPKKPPSESSAPVPDPAPVPGSPPASLPEQEPSPRSIPKTAPPVVELPPGKEPFDLHKTIAGLPFEDFHFWDGELLLRLPDDESIRTDWSGYVLNEPARLAGDFRLQGEWLSAEATVRALKKERVLTFQANLQLDPVSASQALLAMAFAKKWDFEFPVVSSGSPIEADLLAELKGSGSPRLSGEASLRNLSFLLPGLKQPFVLKEGLLLGRYEDDCLEMDAVLRTGEIIDGDRRLSSVGLRFKMDSARRVLMESDVFTFSYNQWSGSGALRGSYQPDPGEDERVGRLEWSFDTVSRPGLTVQPASFLLDVTESQYHLSASPLGIRRATTLWIEDLRVILNSDLGDIESGFAWFNGLGIPMGSVGATSQFSESGDSETLFNFSATEGDPFLSGRYRKSKESHFLKTNGRLPGLWLNALLRWYGEIPVKLSGGSPTVAIDIAGPEHWLKGSIGLELRGTTLTFIDGAVLKGIEGNWRFLLNRLPRSDGTLRLIMESLTAGSVTMRNIVIDWSLPTIRTMRVERASGELHGGIVDVDPFTLDPLKPQLRTRIRFRGIEGNAFLNMLGEDRFAIEGNISGSLGVEWSEGILYLSEGSLKMDTGININRFVFADRDFLTDQFSAMSGVPPELKEPFLRTLLERGIRIDSLTLELIPLPEKGEVSLRLEITGETRSDEIEVPIKGFVINNVIAEDDLGELLGLFGSVQLMKQP